MAKPYIRTGKVVLITDLDSKHYGRIGFNYYLKVDAGTKKNSEEYKGDYFVHLITDGKEIKIKDRVIYPKRFISFKDLNDLERFLVHENDVADFKRFK